MNKILLVIMIVILILLVACEKQYDKPPKGFTIVTDGKEFAWKLYAVSLQSYPTKQKAINGAWKYYLYSEERKNKKWVNVGER